MKSRSKQACKARRRAYIANELKATAVMIISILLIFFAWQLTTWATPLPDTDNSPMNSIEYNIEMNEYKEVFEQMTNEDMDLLARCVMCEAGQSNLECAEATTAVILNRVLSDKFPNTVKGVVNQKGQFTTKHLFYKKTPNALTYAAISNVQNYGARVIRDKLAEQGWDFPTTDYLFFAVGKQKYATDYLFVGNEAKGQHHHIGRAK